MTKEQFREKFLFLKNREWVASTRKGPTGIGHTLEILLGLKENNISLPDLGNIELKAHRLNSNSMITLFTFNRKVWEMNPLEAVKAFGTPDQRGRLGMYFTMSKTPNSKGLFLNIERNSVSIRHIEGSVIARWDIDTLAEQFRRKIPALILVSAQSEMRGDREWFRFTRAQILMGTKPDIIREQLDVGNILIDLRLHDKGASARNHGTAFRVYEEKLPFLFEKIEEL